MTTNKQEVQEEPVGWYTEDHLDDKSATTYKAEVAQRWRDKGWPVWPLYTAPQPAEQPISWIRISGDHVILSRCDWMYPASTEDSAGPRDEQRFTAVGRRDGDIILPAPEGSLDREDLKTMLSWPGDSKPAEQQSAPVSSDEDHVSIPRGLIAAACSAIDKKRDASKVLDELRRYTVGDLSRQSAPDVAGLVEALEACRNELLWMIERHNRQGQYDGSWLYDHQTVAEANAALAAYSKQGGEP